MSIFVRFTCNWYGVMGWQPVFYLSRVRWVN